MTLLTSWVGIDTHGIASIYIASDSRITWGDSAIFDFGRKVFAFNNYPDILGYCGDVLFPSIVLGQIIEMADNGLLFNEQSSCKEKFEAIKEKLIQIFLKYPHQEKFIIGDVIQIIHASREPDNHRKFFFHIIEWRRGKGWSGREIKFPDKSKVIFVGGSGKKEFDENYALYEESVNRSTSRNVFHCFCDTLFNIEDKKCGGAPQLVGIYCKSKSTTKNFGIIQKLKRQVC